MSLDSINSDKERKLIELTYKLLQIPSTTGSEYAICNFIENFIQELIKNKEVGNFDSISIERIQNSIIVTITKNKRYPFVGLFGHIDTVLPSIKQRLEISNEKIYGCGASDMKSGIAIMMSVLEEMIFSKNKPQYNTVFVFYDKEEGPVNESGIINILSLQSFPKLDFAICLEPTDNLVHLGCVGSIHLEIIIKGKRAHSARPWQGENAVYKSIDFLKYISEIPHKTIKISGLDFTEVLSVTQINTNNSKNVIPGDISINLNYRFAPDKNASQAKQELLSIVEKGLNKELNKVEFTFKDIAPSGLILENPKFIQDWIKKNSLKIEPKQAWTDVARLTELGIPAINFGPGETSQAHQANEYTKVSYLIKNYSLVSDLLGIL